MTDRITPGLITDLHDSILNHLAEPHEGWLDGLIEPQWRHLLDLIDQHQRTAPEIADMITWLDNAPFLMGKLTDEEMAKAIDDAIYNAEHWDDPSQGFLRGLRNARSLLLSAPAPKTVTREWVKRTRARLDIEYIPWTEEVLISALREAGVVVEDKSEGEDD